MYNNQIHMGDLTSLADKGVPIEKQSDGSIVIHVRSGNQLRLRKSQFYTLAQFRELFIPPDGLWKHYFSCRKCGFERQNPKIAVCPYCDIQLTEIGSPWQFKEERKGVDVFRVRTDILDVASMEKRFEESKGAKPLNVEKGKVFKITL